jgi:hypothetical protein
MDLLIADGAHDLEMIVAATRRRQTDHPRNGAH